jgi:NAD(P)-dependent dehydrogenase (short-subunit alcohol dehydrogenase family)/uncharacterized OB-fold protein
MTVLLPPLARSRVALGLVAGAAVGRFELQVCRQCGTVQYPPREACYCCLSSLLDWKVQDGRGELLSETTLRHSHHEFFRQRLPIRLGLVRLDCGPTAVAYLDDNVLPAPSRVQLTTHLDRAGLAALVAFAEGGVMRIGNASMTQSSLLEEMVCDPKGRKVLVTSAHSGVGIALVQALVDAGADTVWAGRTGSMSVPDGVELLTLDVTDDRSVHDAATAIGNEVDILINTAEAHSAPRDVAELASAQLEMDINYFGLLRLAQAFGPMLRARAAGLAAKPGLGACAWVNLLSLYALSSAPGQSTFSASKAAAYSFSQSMRADMQSAGVRVINVFPGALDDVRARALPPSTLTAATLAQAIVRGLRDGVEDVYPGEAAQDWYDRWRSNPKVLERELATVRPRTTGSAV